MSVELKRLKLVNFQGIYTALGLKEIEIDRYTSNNNIILILGENGSGKTTILNEITPVPLEHVGFRNRSRIIPDTIGIKELDFLVDDAISYKCKIIYDTKKKTTNCFITKVYGPDEEELNPNGNVTSYMEVLEKELGFNKKYITVGYLTKSLTDFISMKATERNEYISEWLPDISEFLEAYKLSVKLLNKTKRDIDNYNKDIGKMSSLNYELELNQLENNISHYNEVLDKTKSNIIKLEMYRKQIKDNYITKTEFSDRLFKFKQKVNFLRNLGISLKTESDKFNDLNIDISDPISIQKRLKTVEIDLKSNEKNIEVCESTIFQLKTEIDSFNNTLSKTHMNISKNEDLNSIVTKIDEMNESLESYNKAFEPLKDRFNDNIINESDIMVLKNVLEQFEEKFITINNIINVDSIKSIDHIEKMIKLEKDNLINENKIYEDLKNKLVGINNEIYKYENNTLTKNILDKRPDFCINKYCDIVEEIKKYVYPEYACKELKKEASEIEIEIGNINSKISDSNNMINNYNQSIIYLQELNNLLFNNSDLIGKFPQEIINYLEKEPVDIYNNLNNIKYMIDEIYQYSSLKYKIVEMENVIKNLTNTKFIITTKNEINEKLSKNLIDYDNKLRLKKELFNEREVYLEEINKLNNIESYVKDFNIKCNDYNRKVDILKTEKKDLGIYNKHIYYYNVIEDELSKLNNEKLSIESNLIDYNKKRDEMNTLFISKTQLEKMRNELQDEFNRISILNKVWSPKSNISYASLMISDFLNRLTIETNNDLKEMWGTSLKIEEFRLGATEFNIVINRDGTIIDDCSQCSDGEKATLGLAISFAIIEMNIKEHGYNIIRGDEISGPLDLERKSSFLEVLKYRLDKMDCKSCFIISHDKEYDDVECDVILLRGHSINNVNIDNKNVIFRV